MKRFRNIVQWPTLGLAVLLFVGDWWSRVHYVGLTNHGYVDSTPAPVNQIWLLLVFATLVFGILSLPRTPAFLALLSVVWVLYISLQGH